MGGTYGLTGSLDRAVLAGLCLSYTLSGDLVYSTSTTGCEEGDGTE